MACCFSSFLSLSMMCVKYLMVICKKVFISLWIFGVADVEFLEAFYGLCT